jgi:glycogen debranching enzyme
MEEWAHQRGDAAEQQYRRLADQAYASFNDRFWNARAGYLYDVVDAEGGGDDPKCRPNQIFAISLPHPVLERGRWEPVVRVVRDKLLTPVGLRSLAPGHPDYKAKYFGDLRARDAAYHQGTVWGWLVGPFVDAWLKVFPHEIDGAKEVLGGVARHLNDACVGSISEIFDADPPFTPRGCIAQAWSVAEVLRVAARLASLEHTTEQEEIAIGGGRDLQRRQLTTLGVAWHSGCTVIRRRTEWLTTRTAFSAISTRSNRA